MTRSDPTPRTTRQRTMFRPQPPTGRLKTSNDTKGKEKEAKVSSQASYESKKKKNTSSLPNHSNHSPLDQTGPIKCASPYPPPSSMTTQASPSSSDKCMSLAYQPRAFVRPPLPRKHMHAAYRQTTRPSNLSSAQGQTCQSTSSLVHPKFPHPPNSLLTISDEAQGHPTK